MKQSLKNYNTYKEQYERNQQTIKFSDKLYRKRLQDILIDKSEFESLCKIFKSYLVETKTESLFKKEYKNKIKLI